MRLIQLAPWGISALLWFPIAFAGGLGFAPLAFLTALFFLFQTRENRVHPYMLALAAAFVFAALSSQWSPFEAPLVVFDPAEGEFAIKATALRVGLVAILTGLAIGAAQKVSSRDASRVTGWLIAAFLLQGVALTLIVLFTDQALDLFAPLMDDRGEGVQNIGRNAVVFAMASVIVMAALRSWRPGGNASAGHVLALIFALTASLVEIAADSVAGAAAILSAWAMMYVFDLIGRAGWRYLGGATAYYIIVAPFMFSALIAFIGDGKTELPPSAWWRIETWSYAIDPLITEKPLSGWGLDAMRTFRETFEQGRWEGQLMMPNHPHNMLLHVWAETGLLGAALGAACCLLLGWRLSGAARMTQTGQRAAAGLWAAVVVVSSFSFSLWNEWWWALTGLCAAFVVLLDRAARGASSVEETA